MCESISLLSASSRVVAHVRARDRDSPRARVAWPPTRDVQSSGPSSRVPRVAGMAPASAVEARDWERIERLMRESVEAIAP